MATTDPPPTPAAALDARTASAASSIVASAEPAMTTTLNDDPAPTGLCNAILATIAALWTALVAWSQQWCLRIMACGPVPRHVAFIMDGNRRFAKKIHRDKRHGHYLGWLALESALDWCLQLGVQCVTVYAFSIENFKRDQDEVAYLFAMMIDKLALLSTESELVERHQIRIRILGDVRLLPINVQRAAAEAERRTCHHAGAILNICIPYTSRHEILTAVSLARVSSTSDPIAAVAQHLGTAGCPPLDLLVRTSGEHRLSDFLMWQASEKCLLRFVSPAWPEFGFWTFWPSLVEYQLAQVARGEWRREKWSVSQEVMRWDATRYADEVWSE
ncbi:di-trans,poly-cis-decaprenylcistransferase [Allomyces macrogynus ATCC 38327]|uniref:Alkyl transferase n=1 Tax=Allomyces macrogynus (strain ATCC 38327) TaxID=578462 RepID=A0A0L0T2D7_ALLM3|nr:di-trans,poly-cis-decaprenylcistransferase [Allomyces macrogynus ATCC 38327]|eukprot:KNE68887.1 di-trans,poly-cis-decaprenylcistransferase [Allomyces macrogynus ATCC 38327]